MNEFYFPTDHPLNLKTVLGMDFGEKFIGVATYCVNRDPYPTPYGRIANKGMDAVVKELKSIIENECVDLVVIGLPFLVDGKKTTSTERAQNETLSTFEAESRMKASPNYNFQVDLSQIDAVAACVILEDFIRRKKSHSHL
jgi:putative holliday junction resolvase